MQVREIQGATFWQTIEEVKKSETNVVVCFYGDRQENGESWCPDCAKADPVVTGAAKKKEDGVLLIVTVGDREMWKDPANPFRVNEMTKISSIPTLVNWTTGQRLVEEECRNEELVKNLFGLGQASAELLRWFDNLKNDFSNLTMNQKLEALFLMHNVTAPNILSEVSYELMAVTAKDFVGLLPPKVVNKILCYLDGRSLVCCAGVNQKWRSIVTSKVDLWSRAVEQLYLCDDVVKQVTSYQLYTRFGRRVHTIKSMKAELEFPSIPELSHNSKLSSVKNIQSTPSGNLVMSYSVKQPQDFFQKCDVTCSSSKVLASLSTNHVVDFIATDLFLYSNSISGDWHCNVWGSGEEVYKIDTKEYGINGRWFSSFATTCSKCPLLAIFGTNKICTPTGKESYCPIKIITSLVHEDGGLRYGVKRGNFVCSATPNCNALVNVAVISCSDTGPSSSRVPCDHHKVILQQQDFQIVIYKVNTQPTPLTQHDLDPKLLCQLKPTACPDIPQYIFDCYKFSLSHDQKLIGFTCGSQFIYWNLDTGTCRCLTISGGFDNLMLLGIGDMFALVAEVKMLISIQPVLILTGTGEILKVFPALKPSEAKVKKFYNFLTVPLNLSWLGSSGLLCDDVSLDNVMTVSAALHDGGMVFSNWSLVL